MLELLDQILRLTLLVILSVFVFKYKNFKVLIVVVLGLANSLMGYSTGSPVFFAVKDVLAGILVYLLIDYMILERKYKSQENLAQVNALKQGEEDSIIGVELDGTVLSWNKGAEIIYGYTADEMLGKKITRVAPYGTVNGIPELLKRVSKGKTVKGYVSKRQHKDGTVFHVEINIFPVIYSGKVVGASAITRKITEGQNDKN